MEALLRRLIEKAESAPAVSPPASSSLFVSPPAPPFPVSPPQTSQPPSGSRVSAAMELGRSGAAVPEPSIRVPVSDRSEEGGSAACPSKRARRARAAYTPPPEAGGRRSKSRETSAPSSHRQGKQSSSTIEVGGLRGRKQRGASASSARRQELGTQAYDRVASEDVCLQQDLNLLGLPVVELPQPVVELSPGPHEVPSQPAPSTSGGFQEDLQSGRAEPIRLLLSDQGASWTEDEVPLEDWFAGKSDIKKEAVFGQLPQFKDGDFVLYQSNSILRYLGRKYGIAGSSNEESALIDMVNDGVEDLRLKFGRMFFYEFETGKEKYEKELPNHLAAFERILSKNSNGTKYLVGDKISYADYNFLDLMQSHLEVFPACLSSYPLINAFIDHITSRTKLSEYLKSDARINRPHK